jgi:hypothetical protein
MPITSDMIEENKSTKMMKNTLSLFTIIFLVGFISYMFPLGYEYLVIGEIISAFKKESDINVRKDKIYKRISSMDILISLAILALSFGMIGDGTKHKVFIEKSFGMLIGAIFVMGWFMITNQRNNAYYRGLLDQIGSSANAADPNNQLNIINSDLMKLFTTDIPALLSRNMSAAGALLVFFAVIVFPSLYKTVKPESVSFFVLAYGLVFSIYLIYVIDKNSNNDTTNTNTNTNTKNEL